MSRKFPAEYVYIASARVLSRRFYTDAGEPTFHACSCVQWVEGGVRLRVPKDARMIRVNVEANYVYVYTYNDIRICGFD